MSSDKKDSKDSKGKDEKKGSSSSSSAAAESRSDDIYKHDEEQVEKIKESLYKSPPPKLLKICRVSALAAMKMLKHALVGVEAGRKASGTSYEIMGFLVGKVVEDGVVVMDTVPSSVLGVENNVNIDKTLGYVAQCVDSLEKKRPERIVGWYHSHPFDVETYSHCHLSATDVQTQTAYQNDIKEFVAIVVDPLRSLAKQEPEFGAFRVYPPTNKLSSPDECPDGALLAKEDKVKRWGLSADRYYAMKIQFFMSSMGRAVLDIMSRNNLWVRILSSSAIMEPETRQRFAERVRKAADKVSTSTAMMSGGGVGGRSSYSAAASGPGSGNKKAKDELKDGTLACSELAIEQCKGHAAQISKDLLFNAFKRVDEMKAERKEKSEKK